LLDLETFGVEIGEEGGDIEAGEEVGSDPAPVALSFSSSRLDDVLGRLGVRMEAPIK
jgi:hypothetical protein